MNNKFTSTVAGATIFIAAFGLISKGLGFFREILFAGYFGLSTTFDIYLVGAVLPLTINIIILCLAQNYLIPAYNKLKEKDDTLSEHFIRANFYFFILGGIVLSGILYIFSDFIINSYLQNPNPLSKNMALNIFNLFLFTIPINCGISVISAYQQSTFEFKYPAISQLLLNVIVLLVVVLLKDIDIYAIPSGYIIGSVLQFVFLFMKSGKLFFQYPGLTPSFGSLKKFASASLIIIILIESIGQLYVISDRFFFNMVTPGGISALNYAQTIFLLPLSIISIALSTAIFPRFSYLYSKNLNTELEKVFNDGIITNIIIFVPVMFLFMFYGDFILKIIFERGKFSGTDTIITSEALFFYSLSIIFYASYSILNKIIYSTGLINKLLYITIFGIAIKILFNYLLVNTLGQNGLALSTSISYVFFFFASLTVVYKRLAFRNKTFFFTELFFHLLNGLISIFIITQISFLFPGSTFFFLVEISLFLAIFFLNMFLLKNTSAQILLRFIKNIKLSG